jgi:uncharacterized membrane protein
MEQHTNPAQPTTAEVLAEVERRRSEARQSVGGRERRAVILADRVIFWLTKHWLAVANVLAAFYVGLPILAAVLMHLGEQGPAAVIYTVYLRLCHEYPQRSFFLFGPQLTYTLPELVARVGLENLPGYPWPSMFVGNAAVGYKIALCQRDVAIYGTILLAGLAFGVLRRFKVRSLRLWIYALLILPMAIDGGYQWLSYLINFFYARFPPHESPPLLRVLTGTLFGLATVWLAYPHLQQAMEEFRETLHKRFGWK